MSQAANTINPIYIPEELLYPDSDGKPMAENTKQYHYIITIQVGIDSLFASDPDVFVAGDLLWYPYEIEPHTRCAPDVMVAFGRPKGHRGSYKQWKEGGTAPQVVFEILSPGNTDIEMHIKRKNYEKYGVEEYIEYDPDLGTLEIWQRDGQTLTSVTFKDEWISPRLGVKLRLESDGELSLFHPDGRKFLPPAELDRELAQERERAAQERERAAQERERAAQERERAEALAAKLRELGVDPDSL
jgi:Uma2 family endonuclease